MAPKTDIKDLSVADLAAWLQQRGYKPFHAGQINKWIYARQRDDFDEMTDIGKQLRAHLDSRFEIRRLNRLAQQVSNDGTMKVLWGLHDGNRIESVLIPERGHLTLCISTQVGCAQGCRFCLTGRGGLVRNLTRAEILAQIRDVQPRVTASKPLTNIVLMGMGEPLANYGPVVSALNTISDGSFGFAITGRRVTVSTVGIVPKLLQLGRDTRVNLAVSLNAVDDETRSRLMPINRRYPIAQLLAACRQFPLRQRRKITFEYILIKDVNDSPQAAHRLAKLLRPIAAKINLIPFNAFAGSPFRRPDQQTVDRFLDILHDRHYTTIVRYSKGQDICAACGQLSAAGADGIKSDNRSRSQGPEAPHEPENADRQR